MKFFKIDTSDSKTSAEAIFYKEPRNPVTNIFFSYTDVIMDSSLDSNEKNLATAPTAPKNQSLQMFDPLYELQEIPEKKALFPWKFNNFYCNCSETISITDTGSSGNHPG